MKVVIIGGGAGGASCATRLRRLDEHAEIVILEKSRENSIATCGLPYYIGQVISDEKNMHVASAKTFHELFNIDLRLNCEAIGVDPQNKTVRIKNGENIDYDKLVLAMGNSPVVPNISGLDQQPYFVVKHLQDAEKIKTFIAAHNVSSAAVIGGGFIGLEMAENLCKLGIDVSLIELSDQVLPPLDADMVGQVHQELRRHGVRLILGDQIKSVTNREICLNSGDKMTVQMIIVAAGVKPETDFVRHIGLDMTADGLIQADEYMRTNIDDIYACGDCAAVKNAVSGRFVSVPLAGPANRQGRLIADHISGKAYKYGGTLGTGAVKIFDLTAAFVGMNEKQLGKIQQNYHKIITWDKSNAGYYPDAEPLTLKVLYDDEGKILGAQAIGAKNADKQIDVIATIMRLNGHADDLRDAELCYAPPYSSAKSPINMIGMVIQNMRQGLIQPFFGTDFKDMFILDVRPKRMYDLEHIAGAINIPAAEIRSRMNEIPRDQNVLVHCVKGYTSYVVCRILMQHGYTNVFSYAGGWQQYKTESRK